MNIRKNIDYSEMYEALDILMQKSLPQMELYCEIGKAVCRRTEKSAAVMASEYLNEKYPDVKGFSPRSLRRMRDFYRTYENHPALLSHAMKLRWIQNVVIMEADLTMDLREWYVKAARQFNWSKTELIAMIAAEVYMEIVLYNAQEINDDFQNNDDQTGPHIPIVSFYFPTRYLKYVILQRCRGKPNRGVRPRYAVHIREPVICFHAILISPASIYTFWSGGNNSLIGAVITEMNAWR